MGGRWKYKFTRMPHKARGKESEVNKVNVNKYWRKFCSSGLKKKKKHNWQQREREYRRCMYCSLPQYHEHKRMNNPDSGSGT